MTRLVAILDALVSLFDFAGRRAARQAEFQRQAALARATEHEALNDLLEAVLSRVQAGNAGLVEAQIEIAKGVQENAKALNTWMGLFQNTQGEGFTHTVRPLQEIEEHNEREREWAKARGFPVDESPDVQKQILEQLVGSAFGTRFDA